MKTILALATASLAGMLAVSAIATCVGPAHATSKNTAVLVSGTALGAVTIVDGDTLKIDGVKIRIVGMDTPETFRSRCENELVLGLKAKARLRELVSNGEVTYEATGTDRYQRTLAKVYAGGINVGERLVAEGFALRYQPGGDAKLARLRTWCGPDAQLGDTWKK